MMEEAAVIQSEMVDLLEANSIEGSKISTASSTNYVIDQQGG